MMVLNYVNWNVDPEIIEIFGRGIRWYGALLAIGFYLGYMVLERMLKKEGFSEKLISRVSLYMIAGTVLGLRLGHCFFYEPSYYLANPAEIIMVWKGGLASHGGAFGILLAIAIYAYRNKLSYLGLLDRIVVIIPIAGAFVRVGNLMNSEIVGKTTDVPWAFYFPRNDCLLNPDCDLSTISPRHPSQLYEAIFYIFLFLFMFLIYRKMKGRIKEGMLLGIFMILLFGFRFLIEYVKDVQVHFEQSMSFNMGQYLSIPFIIAGIILLIISLTIGRTIDFSEKFKILTKDSPIEKKE